MKLLSLKNKDFSTGLAPYKNDARFGLFYSANGYNPALFGGDIAFTKAPVEITGSVIKDTITGFTETTGVLWGIGNAGHLYKISDLGTTPTLYDAKSTTQLTNPAQSLFAFQTTTGAADYIYYFHDGNKIGQMNSSGSVISDTKFSLTHGNFGGGYIKIDDEVYFGCANYVHKMYDNVGTADPSILEDVLDLPKGEGITSITHDGTYLIISATVENKTKVYFWDYKNNLVSWSYTYKIPDLIYSTKTKNGITYGTGYRGIWAFAYNKYPTLLREDIKSTVGANLLEDFKDTVLINGQNTVLYSYGKVNNNFKTGLNCLVSGMTGYTRASNFSANLSRGFISTSNKLYYVDYETQKTASSDVIKTSYINMSSLYSIDRIDVIFENKLATGDSVAIKVRRTEGTTDGVDYQDYSTISFTNHGAVNNAKSVSTNKLIADCISLELTISGTCVIKQIDIYGTTTERQN